MKLSSLLLSILLLLPAPLLAASGTAEKGTTFTPDPTRFVTLIPHATLDGGVVHLGDIFQGTGEHADRVVAYAPRPGGRAVFDARWLQRVARAFKLNWRPTSRKDRVVIERASRLVGRNEVEEMLTERMIAEGGDASSRVSLSNKSFRLHLPTNKAVALGIDQFNINPSSGRFTAMLTWGNGADDRMRMSGRFERMSDVPVLSNRAMRGDLISQSDIEWIQLPEVRLSRTTITDVDHIIGMAAKRAIQPGRPVTEGDVRRPLLVNRGETVTMLLTTPLMELSAKGRALQAGSKGDIIRISNLQTNTVIDAVVTGPGQARVDLGVNLAMR